VHDTWARLRDRPFVSETVRGLGDSERTCADHEAVVIQRQGRKPLARLVRSWGDEFGID
jgi:hypothetical protein